EKRELKKEAGHGGPARKIAFVMRTATSSGQTCDYRSHFGPRVGHGNGPSGVGTLGIAAYANVPTRPTNSSNALSERFMGLLLLRVCREVARKPPASGATHYTQLCNFLIHWRLVRVHWAR